MKRYWDYRSFKCKTAVEVKEQMEKSRVDGWEFSLVYKLPNGSFMLQMKKKPEETH
jgi:hypothetical protein